MIENMHWEQRTRSKCNVTLSAALLVHHILPGSGNHTVTLHALVVITTTSSYYTYAAGIGVKWRRVVNTKPVSDKILPLQAHAPAAATAWRCEALYKLGSKKGCDAPISIHLPGGRQIDSSRSRLCRSRIYGLGHYVFSLIIVLTGGNSRWFKLLLLLLLICTLIERCMPRP